MDFRRTHGSRDSDLNVSLNLSDIEDSSRLYHTDSFLTGEESELRDINEDSSVDVGHHHHGDDGDAKDEDENPYKTYQQFYIDVSQSGAAVGCHGAESNHDDQTRSLHEFETLEQDTIAETGGHATDDDGSSIHSMAEEPLAEYLLRSTPHAEKTSNENSRSSGGGERLSRRDTFERKEGRPLATLLPSQYHDKSNRVRPDAAVRSRLGSDDWSQLSEPSQRQSRLPLREKGVSPGPLPKRSRPSPSPISQRAITPSRIPRYRTPSISPVRFYRSPDPPSQRPEASTRRRQSPSPQRQRQRSSGSGQYRPRKPSDESQAKSVGSRGRDSRRRSGESSDQRRSGSGVRSLVVAARYRESSTTPRRSPVTPSVSTKLPTPVQRSPSGSPHSMVRRSGPHDTVSTASGGGSRGASKIPRLPSPLMARSFVGKLPSGVTNVSGTRAGLSPNKLAMSAPVGPWTTAGDRSSPSRLPVFVKGGAAPIRKPVPVTPKLSTGMPAFNLPRSSISMGESGQKTDEIDAPDYYAYDNDGMHSQAPDSPVSPSSSTRGRYMDTQDQVTWEGTSDVEMRPWSEDPSALPQSPPPKPYTQLQETDLLTGFHPAAAKESSVDTPVSVFRNEPAANDFHEGSHQPQPTKGRSTKETHQSTLPRRHGRTASHSSESSTSDFYHDRPMSLDNARGKAGGLAVAPSSTTVTTRTGLVPKPSKDPAAEVAASILEQRRPSTQSAITPAAKFRNRSVTMGSEHPEDIVQQLQLDYEELLEKYALAENTIDQLRLGAHLQFYTTTTTVTDGHTTGTAGAANGHRANASSSRIHGERHSSDSDPSSTSRTPMEKSCLAFMFRVKKLAEEMGSFATLLEEGEDHLTAPEQEAIFINLKKSFDMLQADYRKAKDNFKRVETDDEVFDKDQGLERELFKLGLKMDDIQVTFDEVAQSQINSSRVPFLNTSVEHGSAAGHTKPRRGKGRKLARRLRKLKKMPKTPERDRALQQVVQAMERLDALGEEGVSGRDSSVSGDSSSEEGVTVIDNLPSASSNHKVGERERHGSYSSTYSAGTVVSVRSGSMERKVRRLQDSDSGFIGSEGSRHASSMEKLGGVGARRPATTQLSAIPSETSQAGEDLTDHARTAQWATRQKNHFGPVLPNRIALSNLGPSARRSGPGDRHVPSDTGSHVSHGVSSSRASSRRERVRELQEEVAQLRERVEGSVVPSFRLDISSSFDGDTSVRASSPFNPEPSPRKRAPHHQLQAADNHDLDLSDSDASSRHSYGKTKTHKPRSHSFHGEAAPVIASRPSLRHGSPRGGTRSESRKPPPSSPISTHPSGETGWHKGALTGEDARAAPYRSHAKEASNRPSGDSVGWGEQTVGDTHGGSRHGAGDHGRTGHGGEVSRSYERGNDRGHQLRSSSRDRNRDRPHSYYNEREERGQGDRPSHAMESSTHDDPRQEDYRRPSGSYGYPPYREDRGGSRNGQYRVRPQSSLGLPTHTHSRYEDPREGGSRHPNHHRPDEQRRPETLSMGDLGTTYSQSHHNLSSSHVEPERTSSPVYHSNNARYHSGRRYDAQPERYHHQGRQPAERFYSDSSYVNPTSRQYSAYRAPPSTHLAMAPPAYPRSAVTFRPITSSVQCESCRRQGEAAHACPTCGIANTPTGHLTRAISEPNVVSAVTAPLVSYVHHPTGTRVVSGTPVLAGTPVVIENGYPVNSIPVAVSEQTLDQSYMTRSVESGKMYVTQPIQLEPADRSRNHRRKDVRFYLDGYNGLAVQPKSENVIIHAKHVQVSESDGDDLDTSIERARRAMKRLKTQSTRMRKSLSREVRSQSYSSLLE